MKSSVKKITLWWAAASIAGFLVSGCVHESGTTAPSNPASTIDTDKDGTPNMSDTDIDNDNIPNGTDTDVDGDGTPNNTDTDVDGDGIPNTTDTDIDGDQVPNNTDSDIDGDATPNNTDTDIDGDQVPNNTDSNPNGTDTTGYISGIAVASIDTVKFSFSIKSAQGTGTVSSDQTIDLQKVRNEIGDNGIALSTFSFTDLKIVSAGADAFITANKDARVVLRVSYLDQTSNKILVLESADKEGLAGKVLTVGDMARGVNLNSEIFAASPGFLQFTELIKNTSAASTKAVIDITFLTAVSQGDADLTLNLIIKASGKKSS
jgi:hypothetical protein